MNRIIYPRLLQAHLEEVLDDTPVALIHGPRQCGKTTLSKQVGEKRGYRYLSFDDVNLVAAAKADPVGFIDRLEQRVILDEVQHVPELFSSIKQRVDNDRKAGSFLLTGSTNILLLPKLSDSLAGRMEILNLRPLARCEIENAVPSFLSRILNGDYTFPHNGKLGRALGDILLDGGFPEPLQRHNRQRKRQWYRNYITTIIQRDIRDFARIGNLTVLPDILRLVATQTAQLLNMSRIAAPFQISRPTTVNYFTLLANIFLIDVLQPWHSNLGKRLIKTPKVHIADTGLAGVLLGVTPEQLETDRTTMGHLLETFVYNELHRQASWSDAELVFYHFRDKDLYEVDIVIEESGGGITGVEVKAAATVEERDFRGLKKLRSVTREKAWRGGILFYDGDSVLSFGADLYAVPVSALWGK